MGREVRRVPPTWVHPEREVWVDGVPRKVHRPLHDASYAQAAQEWEAGCAAWCRGERDAYHVATGDGTLDADTPYAYALYEGGRPSPDEYMPEWSSEQCTHLMLYETTSEGTPLSPAFATPEELARWCTDKSVSIFGYDTASYETWLRIARGARAIGLLCSASGSEQAIIDGDVS